MMDCGRAYMRTGASVWMPELWIEFAALRGLAATCVAHLSGLARSPHAASASQMAIGAWVSCRSQGDVDAISSRAQLLLTASAPAVVCAKRT
ncbi:hypothetical protein L226DRAFT_536907 [Lentinus tigrinus ALCF2SS1-7]|uniref:uncharacterized protein n=1 Tax=Lentinus tigrinus ALCF2SS1-7 TaxID=1328758 RepID=UPI001165D7A4|nr:hypothetical protein L226DRAFT_536907 [Lentinus tigrinus ALCF2SS1-7]